MFPKNERTKASIRKIRRFLWLMNRCNFKLFINALLIVIY